MHQLDSPQHRRIPERRDHAPIPFALPNANLGLNRSASSDVDPFHVPSAYAVQREPSPVRAMNALAELRAQAATTSALLRPVRHRGGRHNQIINVQPQMPMVSHANAQAIQGHAHLQFNVDIQPMGNPPPPLPPLPPAPLPLARRPFNSNPNQIHNVGKMDLVCRFCKAYHWKAEQLSKKTQGQPNFGTCCFSGKVITSKLDDIPRELQQLLDGNDAISKKFREYIRNYNNALAMTSVEQDAGKCLNDREINDGRGPYVYKVRGELHHIAGTLLPPTGQPPQFAQLYIYDPVEQLDYHMSHSANRHLDRNVMQTLQDMLWRKHAGVQLYKQTFEIMGQAPPEADFTVKLRFDKDTDQRRYNLPTSTSEIAVVVPGSGEEVKDNRDIILRKKHGGLQRINELHPLYHALHFVLLFPTGQLGWHPNLPLILPNNEAAPDEEVAEEQQEDLGGDALEQQLMPGEHPQEPDSHPT